nr:ribosomal protein L32 [Pilea cavernicola]WDS80981.1 ribosomal protein L32 [Pilea cavernicola]
MNHKKTIIFFWKSSFFLVGLVRIINQLVFGNRLSVFFCNKRHFFF